MLRNEKDLEKKSSLNRSLELTLETTNEGLRSELWSLYFYHCHSNEQQQLVITLLQPENIWKKKNIIFNPAMKGQEALSTLFESISEISRMYAAIYKE